MRDINKIKLPYKRNLASNIFTSEITIGGRKGSVVVGLNEDGMEHVSFSPYDKNRIPSWSDMCELKTMFWEDEEEVYQIMPKKSEYVNIKGNCLHL